MREGLGGGRLDTAGEAAVLPTVATATVPRPRFELSTSQVTRTLAEAVAAAQRHLLSLQHADGHWCAELEGDTILESEYLMLLWYLGKGADERFAQGCRFLRERQLEEGGWAIYPGGPPSASPSVKAYFVLRLNDDEPEAPHMVRARESIVRMGGVSACNTFTKLYLAIFGQWRWEDAPAVPPELILLPRWFYFNVYEMSSWSRAIVVPLAVIWASRPHCEVPISIDELVLDRRLHRRGESLRERFCFSLFRGIDSAIKLADRLGAFQPIRERALERCVQFTVERFDRSAGLAGIFPAIMNAVIALRERGWAEDHPLVQSQLQELRKLEIVEGEPGRETLRLQPCCSPVWDTALSMSALLESGVDGDDSRLQRAAEWLLEKEVRQPGDWQVKNPDVEPGGWYFEYANEFYPDCDDTAEVLGVLGRLRLSQASSEAHRKGAVRRALCWQLAMQNRDGGWGAFDRECNKELLTYIPFADHNAMIDPSTTDVTARTVEALVGYLGREHAVIRRAVRFLRREQEKDGSWYGRWGSNYLYGTWLALGALAAAGRRDSVTAAKGVAWLLEVQSSDGGWGETPRSYSEPSYKGQGPSTAAQTAWAMMGLLSIWGQRLDTPEARPAADALERACSWLLKQQLPEGGWEDVDWTGTGFPSVFYLRYYYYDRYFPLQALAAYECALERLRSSS